METDARHTGENVTLTRELLKKSGVFPASALVICRPYQQRRAYATFRAGWPEIDIVCSSRPLPLPDYVASIGDPAFVINMIVGDTQRVIDYPQSGFAIEQTIPDSVRAAFNRVVAVGFTSHLASHAQHGCPPSDPSKLHTHDIEP